MNSKESALIELVNKLDLETKIKGLIDLCNGVTLFELFFSMINQDDKSMFFNDYIRIHEINQELSYEELKLRNLDILARNITKYSSQKGIDLKIKANLQKIGNQNNINELRLLIRSVFSVLIEQKELIQLITTLSKETQHQLMEIFKEIMSGENSIEKNEDFLEKISELESQIEEKDQVRKNDLKKVDILTAENQELKDQISLLKKDTEQFRKKNQSFQQLQTLFTKKDSDISALQEKIQQLKLSNLRQKQEYQKQISDLQRTIENLKKAVNKYETEAELQRLKLQLEDKGKALQQSTSILQEERTVLKKIKQRCTVLEDKNKGLEDLKFELSLKLEEKEIQKDTLNMKLSDLEERVKDDQDRRDSVISNSGVWRKSESLGLELNAKFSEEDNSIDQCPNVECQKLKQQLNIYKNKCLELIKSNEILRGNSTDRSSIIDKSSEQVSSRLSNLTAQNVKLKEKVATLSTNNSVAQYQESINKQKRKFLNLKKKMAEDEEIRNKQAELMMSTMYEMRKIIQQNISGPKLVEVLRKLK